MKKSQLALSDVFYIFIATFIYIVAVHPILWDVIQQIPADTVEGMLLRLLPVGIIFGIWRTLVWAASPRYVRR